MASPMHNVLLSWVAASAVVFALGVSPAEAGLVAQGTRVVFPGNEREVTLRVNNTSSVPVLAQAWIDDGREDVPPEQLNMPFSITPAVARVEPNGGLVLRVAYLGTALPKDRESVFWLNILEVPPRDESDENALQFSFRSRLKLFFRPSQLKSAESAPEKLRWKLVGSAGRSPVVRVDNPTPYFVSFSDVEVLVDGRAVSIGNGMVSPFSRKDFGAKKNMPLDSRNASVRYEVINDYGGRSTLERAFGE
ncbi:MULTISPECIES: fimbrial biogenesis chaperone [Pseudomonas aeruginosa group]|uniref:fimbrial biogenesis chaperone n=2 Tax=Pseudomonas aeruginosa group TaxID=136841 RepID=UPI0005B9A6F4|nr:MULTISPECIES: fimbria/pilus periplasmic chaperone [Pseudomonas aeruginosa group]VTS38224.1 Chaperone protein papD precursor [Streptococcus dysgalactiae subsp. equisimilis]AVR66231.1 molecular chaperone [Pseudomonas paraeruginosa]KPD27219.1 molecular chaperone [Pseudomonas paraeruginosa]KQB32459.1 molecular chaperone [Pseudomonas paraeruginosa]KRU84270.1 molecular chaperone [Pseudomonas aeruginosa]